MRRTLDGLYATGAALAALCVLAIFVLMIGASIGRSLLWRVGWVNDVVSWLCAAAAFLGMATAFATAISSASPCCSRICRRACGAGSKPARC